MFGNVKPNIMEMILAVSNYKRAYTPIKFLGVPLISSRLSARDCKVLLEKIIAKVTHWTSKLLSFAGRVQLIKSILFAVQAYWSAHFSLPASILRDLSSILSRFLWKGSSLLKHGAKVAWNKVSLPFSEGGLNIKDLKDWNTANTLFHLWQIINPDSTSLWAKWIRNTVIKDKSFWQIPIPSDCSWIWRKVLNVRNLALQHIQFHIGTGTTFSLWFDPWYCRLPLAESGLDPIISNSGLRADARISTILNDSGWNLPTSNYYKVRDLRTRFNYNTPYNLCKSDTVTWDTDALVSVTTIWNSIRKRGNPVDWHLLLWRKSYIPRFSFVSWLVFQDGLYTKDKLLRFGLTVDSVCVLCHAANETISHLFFNCSFSFSVLFCLLRACGWRGFSRDWSTLLSMIRSTFTGLKQTYASLALTASIYGIWQERNSRIHNNTSRSATSLSRQFSHLIKCRLHSYSKFTKNAVRQGLDKLLLDSLG